MSKGWPNIDIKLAELPKLEPPDPYTRFHNDDIDAVRNYVLYPVNNSNFLEIANDSPFKLFENFCRKNSLEIDKGKYDILNDEMNLLLDPYHLP